MSNRIDNLKLENQLSFQLYVCSKEIIRKYQSVLESINLTYTQYIVMMVLWEKRKTNVKELSKMIYLDSGTLTPLLIKLEKKGYITRTKDEKDARNLIIKITNRGLRKKDKMLKIFSQMDDFINLEPNEEENLYNILYKIINNLDEKGE